jgi:hypothetical protein
MSKLVRLLACALLAAFAAGSVVQAASATTMALKMAFAGSGAMDMAGDMAGCEGCGSGDNAGDGGLACQAACLAPLAAILSQETALAPLPGASPASSAVDDVVGRTAPPEPHPPRTLI